ncbi:MAG: hypothetical protein HUU37_08765 [Bdellovibrionales bacterium]|nr:hypothetical protein [Bdellovibrionales bacterium]
MKFNKGIPALLMVAAIALSGCGKKDDENKTGVIGATGFNYTYGSGGSNGCAQIGVAGDGSMSFPITGQAQIGYTGFSANTTVGGSGFTGGNYYVRTNYSGDTIQAVISGTVGSVGTINATVRLSPTTVSALGGGNYGYGYGYQPTPICVQGIAFQNTGLTAGSPGSMYGTIIMYTNRGTVGL